MKNIGKCRKWRILACISVLGVLFACTDYVLQDGESPTVKRSKHQNEELTISAAKQWFESNFKPVVATRAADGYERLNKPYWDKAKEANRRRYEVVETPVLTRGTHIVIDSETATHWQPDMKSDFIRNTTRMVVLRDTKTGKTRSFIMTFVGTYDYLKKTRTIGKNSYLYREPDFSGAVLFHDLDGAFINGWRYSDGKIVASLSKSVKKTQTKDLPDIATRAEIEVCRETCYPTYEQRCDPQYVIVGGDMESGFIYDIDDNCESVYAGDQCTEDCYWEDDGSGDGEDNWWENDYPPGGAGESGGTGDNPPPAILSDIDAIYGAKSTLTSTQKVLLEIAIDEMNQNPYLKKIFDALRGKVRIHFSVDPNINANGQYNASTVSIKFASDTAINSSILREELIHAAQHSTYGIDVFNPNNKFNIEFEAHLFTDIAMSLPYDRFYVYSSHIFNSSCKNETFRNAIENLMSSIINSGGFFTNQLPLYEVAAKSWNPPSYTGSYTKNLPPKLLYDIF